MRADVQASFLSRGCFARSLWSRTVPAPPSSMGSRPERSSEPPATLNRAAMASTAVPLLAASGLKFGYVVDNPIIDNLHVEFPRETVTALTGRSGTGKSTLLYILGLMLRASG